MNPDTALRHLYLVDGSGYIFRAFHALPPLTRSDGTPVGAVAGFCNMLWKLEEEALGDGPSHLAVIFDAGRRSFRNDIYADYKANRAEPPPELVPQFALVREATRAFNLACIEQAGYEADDLIATYARRAAARGARVTIVSSDKDLMQLVDARIGMWDPIKMRPIGREEVIERFGVGPEKVVEVQALAGDSTDNVPGVPGIGVKTAAELITTYGDLESLLAHAGEIKQPKRRETLLRHAEQARLSRKLVALDDKVPLEVDLDALGFRPPDPARLLPFLEKMEFRRLVERVNARLRGSGELLQKRAAPAPHAPRPALAAPPSRPNLETPRASLAEPRPGEGAGYALVVTAEALDGWIAQAQAQGEVAVDVATGAPDAVRAGLVGLALALAPGRACYIPLGHRSPRAAGGLDLGDGEAAAPAQIPMQEALRRLKPLLEDPAVLKIGHDIKYDTVVLSRHGIDLAPVDDAMLVSYVLGNSGNGHDLGGLSELHLGHRAIAFGDVAGSGRQQVTLDRVPLDRARDYSAGNADIAWRLRELLKPRLLQEHLVTVYETIERPLVPVVAAMERAGIKVDAAELRRLSEDFARRLEEIEAEIHRLAGHPFNIGSPKQLGEVLFDEMGLGGGKKGKTGAYATGHEVLEELAAQGHALPARVLDWRQLSKLKSTYTDALTTQINRETGRVHTCYALAVASTGRLSSTDPNLQNIPIRTEEGRKIRHAFVAEPGHRLLSVDYSQIELRLAAHLADVAALKQAFRDGVDIHAMTASQVFGVPVEGMDPLVRRRAKAINFGIIYGISPFGLAQQLGIGQAEAKAYIDAYFERYPGIRDYMEAMKRRAREAGYVTTLFGRRCHVPGINDRNPAKRGFMERVAINAPLQGTAADIIKRAMIRVPPALERAKLKARMLLQVHDELLFEVPEAEVEETAALVKQVMERAPLPAVELSVPLVAEIGIGANWAEAH